MRTESVSRKVSAWGVWISPTLLSVAILFLPFATLVFPRASSAASCTVGTNCYCDRVRGGDLKDSQLLFCEDFEALTLHDNVGLGNGAPYYGPWYDHGSINLRGFGSYWTTLYGPAVQGCDWVTGQPATPTVGEQCTSGTGLCVAGAWRPDDLWQANSFACISIPRNGEFEVTPAPSGNSVGGSGVFDGQQSLGQRVAAGRTAGVLGVKDFTSATTLGITMAVAYPTTIASTGVLANPWKHNQFSPTITGGNGANGLLLFHNGFGLAPDFPVRHFIFLDAGTGETEATCQAKVNAATVRRGTVFCNAAFFGYNADSSYLQPRDFPFGTWGCAQAYYQGFGTGNLSVKIWVNNKLVIDFDGMDDRGLQSRSGYDRYLFDNYANTNQGDPGSTPTNQVAYRYEDNIHIRAGAPVSCSQIGFTAATPPTAPSGLLVQ